MDDLRNSTFFACCCQLMALILVVIVLNGCAGPRKVAPPLPPGPIVSPPTEYYKPEVGPAAALYSQAEKALQSGRPAESEMLIERALRIEPRNPYYWHTMAQIKYLQGQYRETVQFCLKSDSLAGKQLQLVARNKELMRQAKKALLQK